jgi:NADPH:quinone reductase-like Zn-dependent oxidoreductase
LAVPERYRSVVVTRYGGPEVLRVVENEMRDPAQREVRIRVLAAAVSRPDITVRTGQSLYSGTPLGQKTPFVPGYAVIGDVDALGTGVTEVAVGDRVGALTVTGGYAEYLLQDWATLFKLLEERRIEPIIMQTFPLLEAAKANALLESGQVIGNVVLVAPDIPM